ncbi:hypothetical protein NIES4074_23990 [Cylindrospermum sp. NIES-4074]|nr:hypothetical protein NIES4074_23990 [Cylindrospermum sp. NIES-4074]
MAYSDISRGVRLAKDHEKYMQWLNKDTEARQTAYEAVTTPGNKVKTARVAGYVAPFGATGSALVYAPVRLIAETQSGRGSNLAITVREILLEFTNPTLEATEVGLVKVKFSPARMSIIQRVTTATTKSASRITGRRYYRHENDSVTGCFGKKIVADDYNSTVTAIKLKPNFKALFTGSENAVASRHRFVNEGEK